MRASLVCLAAEMIANSFRGAYHTKMWGWRERWRGWGGVQRDDALGFLKHICIHVMEEQSAENERGGGYLSVTDVRRRLARLV